MYKVKQQQNVYGTEVLKDKPLLTLPTYYAEL